MLPLRRRNDDSLYRIGRYADLYSLNIRNPKGYEGGCGMNNREIDRLVAEKIMGWEVRFFANINVIEAYTEYEETVIIGEDFSPTTDIQDAWLVVEKLEEKQIVSLWWIMQRIRNKGINSAKQIPYHICLAALKAVDVEVQS